MKEGINVIAPDVKLGKNVLIYNFVNLYGCEIGDETRIGAFVEIQKNARIGKRCKIQSHTFICEGVDIKDGVFVGHGVMFINDTMPPQPEKDKWLPTTIEDGASLGSNSTIMPVRVGKDAVVGAGAVVTRDVPDGAVVAGCPAKILRYKDGYGPEKSGT